MNPLQIAETIDLIRRGGTAQTAPHVLIADVLDALHDLTCAVSSKAAAALDELKNPPGPAPAGAEQTTPPRPD